MDTDTHSPLSVVIAAVNTYKQFVGLEHDIRVDTCVFKASVPKAKQTYPMSLTYDIHTMRGSSKKPISCNDIIYLYNKMDIQYAIMTKNGVRANTTGYGKFVYDAAKNMYVGEMDRDNTAWMERKIIKILDNAIGSKENVTINSGLYSTSRMKSVNECEDFHVMFGNDDKEITIEDMEDVITEMEAQLEVVQRRGRMYSIKYIGYDENCKINYFAWYN